MSKPWDEWIFDENPEISFKRGDLIGSKYKVHEILGKGSFGVVYLVFSKETNSFYALKTFQDRYLENYEIRERFQKEAGIWIDVGNHPFIVNAYYVDNINGRFYIAMEYIPPGNDNINSIDKYIRYSNKEDLMQSIQWAIQFCYGIEYAYSKGITAHRDIKPDNILIDQNKVIKISDFGFPGIAGNHGYISPEQRENPNNCDEKSDIYSFGVVLHQIVALGNHSRFLYQEYDSQNEGCINAFTQFKKSPIYPIIKRCIERDPDDRYQNFGLLRLDLERILKNLTSEKIEPPNLRVLSVGEWCNKGLSLYHLGRYYESIDCCYKAIQINPLFAGAYLNKGLALQGLGLLEEAINCYDDAIRLNSEYKINDELSLYAWNSKGTCYNRVIKYKEAIECYDNAIKISPTFADSLNNKAECLSKMSRLGEAYDYIEKAYTSNPEDIFILSNKGFSLECIGEFEEAIKYYDRALRTDPLFASAWFSKGSCLRKLHQYVEAIACFDNAARFNSSYADRSYSNRGLCFWNIERYEEALDSFNKAIRINEKLPEAWLNKASLEKTLGHNRDALQSILQFFCICSIEKIDLSIYARRILLHIS